MPSRRWPAVSAVTFKRGDQASSTILGRSAANRSSRVGPDGVSGDDLLARSIASDGPRYPGVMTDERTIAIGVVLVRERTGCLTTTMVESMKAEAAYFVARTNNVLPNLADATAPHITIADCSLHTGPNRQPPPHAPKRRIRASRSRRPWWAFSPCLPSFKLLFQESLDLLGGRAVAF